MRAIPGDRNGQTPAKASPIANVICSLILLRLEKTRRFRVLIRDIILHLIGSFGLWRHIWNIHRSGAELALLLERAMTHTGLNSKGTN